MIDPASFETAWTEAERRAFEVLVAAAGGTENRDAFLGRNPGILNAWHFTSLDVTNIGESVLLARDLPSLGIPYYAECAYLNRNRCQEWAMRVIAGLPLVQDEMSNIALFRINGIGGIDHITVDVPNEKQPVDVWGLRLTFDLVFATGGKQNAVTATA